MFSAEKCIQDFGREMRALGCPTVDGRVILKWLFKNLGEGAMYWIDLSQDKDRCRAVVNSVMNLRVP